MTQKMRRRRIAFTRSAFLFAFFLFALISATFSLPVLEAEIRGTSINDVNEFDGTFPDWYTGLDSKTDSDDFITYTQYRTSYCTFSSTTTQCDVTDDDLTIRFDTAEELYRWSIDVSVSHYYGSEVEKFTEAQVAVILNQDYALGTNIDYSTMASKTFSPIGYSFNDAEEVPHSNYFTGTFDGRGFVISNLYVAGYDYMVYPDENEGVAIDIALSNYYSMFLINGGEIHDFGLINPTLEMLNLHIDITMVSNLVGVNLASGIVDHVFVIDTRTSVTEAGIRYKVGTSSGTYSGAGIVHTNQGVFTNAYYSSILVINGSYFNKFSAQPVLYTNTGTYGHLVYDSTVYLYPTVTVGSSTFTVTPPNALATGESTTMIKSGTGSALNHDTDRWYFYASDCYPLTQGLDWDTDHYVIENAVDLAFFSRVLAFSTQNNGVSYAAADYHLTADIDMSMVAPGTYKTPSVNFTGTLSGDNPNYTDEQGYNYNYYIYNLTFTTGTIRSTAYYTGLFSILSGGTVDRLNLTDVTIALTDTETYYGYTLYVGTIAGRIITGTVSNVLVNAAIDLGSTSIGTTYLGGIVGVASGTISQTAFSGTIAGGTHTFNASYAIAPLYNFGGIVGAASSTAQLTLSSVRNNATLTGLSTSSTLTLASGSTQFMMRLGGIVGYIPNSSSIRHRLVNVANFAGITCGVVTDPAGYDAYQHVGGVFGELSGYAPVLEADDEYLFANLYNSGNVTAAYNAGTSTIRAAGIGVSNTTEAVEYALLFNHGSFAFSNPPSAFSGIFRYTGTIYDIGTSAVTISRSYNFGNRTYSSSYYSTSINPFYYSANNRPTLLRYCANYGNIYFWNNSGGTKITLSGNLVLSGITSCTNVDYLNVTNYGNITVVNVDIGLNSLFIAGITKELSGSTTLDGSTYTIVGNYMKNCMNEGNIVFAEITGSVNIVNNLPDTSTYGNIYVGGLVAINRAGDLHSINQSSTQPRANLGVINSINKGNLSSSYGEMAQSLYGILGMSNTFVAGIAAINAGSIQDSANFGNITVYNSSSSTSTPTSYTPSSISQTFSNTMGTSYTVTTYTGYNIMNTSSSYVAGIWQVIRAGVIAGGISAVSVDGIGRIYDTANNGNIVAIAYGYSRAGGILGVSLYEEAFASGITSSLGLQSNSGTDPNRYIAKSVLSNGLNLGNISAITAISSVYSTNTQDVYSNSNNYTQNTIWVFMPGSDVRANSATSLSVFGSTIRGSEERPSVYGAAGGVIAYGLCVMRRMLNHGTISGTNVAGGIVGATYVIGTATLGESTTLVDINTAINYGEIEAINTTSFSGIVADSNALGFSMVTDPVISGYFLTGTTRTTFLFPQSSGKESIRLCPGTKPGFGGIFGRLQRGTNGQMSPEGGSFDFIVNANPDIDLIGRIDQVLNWTASSSAYFFRSVQGKYFSARTNDTTQAIFTGYYFGYGTVTRVTVSGLGTATTRNVYTANMTAKYEIMGKNTLQDTTWTTQSVVMTGGYYYGSGTNATGATVYFYYAPITVPFISEEEAWNSTYSDYMYDENFIMRKNDDSYSSVSVREYTIDAGTGGLKNPSGTTIIDGTLLFSSLALAQAYKDANPSSTPYYYDANNDIRNLDGDRVFALGNPYSITTSFDYQTALGVYYPVLSPYGSFTVDGNGNLISSTSTVASAQIFTSSASAASYDAVYNTPYYYNNTSTSSTTRGCFLANGTRTHNVSRNSTAFIGVAPYADWTLTSGSMYLTSSPSTKMVDSTVLFTTQAAAQAYVKKNLFYWTGTVGSSNLQQYNGSIVYTFVSGTTFTYNGDYYIYSGGNLYHGIVASGLFSTATAAYNYKVANPTLPVFYTDRQSNIQKLTLKSAYYVSTNFSINASNDLVDSVGATVIPAADLDGSPYTIDSATGHIINSSGAVLYRFISALTNYIYFMEYNLLASRFRAVEDGGTGENTRPNGMYVLSTTAGSTFGSVLPANLDTDHLKPIDEDLVEQLSLLGDYTSISPTHLADLDSAVLTKYDNLRQTIFNDKSALLEDPGAPVTLTEVGGSGTVLSNPAVDYVNKTLTFSISMEAFLSGQTSVSYVVTYAETSAQALIAQQISEYTAEIPANDVYDYRAALKAEGANGVSVTYAPHLSIPNSDSPSFPDHGEETSPILSLGYFVIYSEAFVGADLFVGANYYTEFQVFITFTPSADSDLYLGKTLGITTVAFNGDSPVDIPDITGNGSVVDDGDVNYNGSITFNFTDTKGVLTEGQDLKTYVRILLEDGTTVVGTSYYTLTSTPITIAAGTGTGSVTVTFTNQTKMGNYRFYYKYFSSSTEYYVTFDKAASNVATVTDLDHYSESGSLSIGGTTITSSVNFGYPITLGSDGTSGNFTSSTNGALPSYLDRTTYTVVYNANYSNTFAIAPFATLTNAYLSSTTYTNGYKVYTIVYVITAENGTTSTTYTHTMTERAVDLTSVLKDGNEVALDDIHAQRDAEETVFTVDLGLDQSLNLYRLDTSATLAYITASVSYFDGSSTIDITNDLSAYDIIFTVGNYLILSMGYDADPGDYTFTFYLQRGNSGSYVTLATTLVITKDKGTNSHLTDIRFSDLANETDYPDIYIVNTSDVAQTTPYDPAVYFAGIDYDGADAIQNYHYHVDGAVSNTPLDDFLPYMIDYLPYGATISRWFYNTELSTWDWTDPVGADATEAELALLATDFTHDPETGDDANVVVQYRVTSEDGNNYTYYFVTVTDVTYNVTLVFDIYYCTGENEDTCTIASESAGFANRLVIVTVQNLVTDGDDTVINVTNPIDYPDFTVVTGLYNQVTQFYYTYNGDYRYSFGRNRSGFFSFSLNLPKDQYLNELYEYEIKYGDYLLDPMSRYITGMEGKYFYIEYSNKNRTRRFNVYIRDISSPATSHPWGLWDFFVSWWE